ncbi:RIP metalloprotease RseP [Flavobacterium beibuense]|uniref:Zinc metalloprotease n=1 Tax=Flavobacterium beibuense TaxID=657326 RepID=A0A444WD60_9FLAO|nr:RIP metalloprotease RseP [Flavobacterium beibuense]RYJ43770.1 Peptidase family M50 [Flavobacterium beibuense]
MEVVIKLSQFLLSLSLLIVLHELGHFIPAKLFKTKVEKFYLFFDIKYSLFKKKIGETVYGIGWLPLGGYVKIAGMIDESMDKEQMAEEPKPWEFRSKPAWQRLIIMLGGVTVNFILAFVIYIGIAFYYGENYIPNSAVKDGIWIANPTMEEIGLKTGDKIISVDGEKVDNFYSVNEKLFVAKKVLVERDGKEQEISLPIDFIGQLSESGKKSSIAELRVPFVVIATEEGSINHENVKPKDIVVNFNGNKVKYADEVIAAAQNLKGQTVNAVVLRDKKEVPVQLKIDKDGKFEITQALRLPLSNIEELKLYEVRREKYGFFESFSVGTEKGYDKLVGYGKQLKVIFTPKTGAYKEVGGFYAIFDIFPNTWSWEAFWNITAILSIMLGVMNLLPIPALDGGHVMFLLFEMITGRKPGDKFMEYAQITGFVLLITLVLLVNGNDIFKIITGK